MEKENKNIKETGANTGNLWEFTTSDFVKKNLDTNSSQKVQEDELTQMFSDIPAEVFEMKMDEIDRSALMRLYLQKLKDDELIKSFDLDIPQTEVSVDTIIELSKKSLNMGIDAETDDVYYIDADNKKQFLNFDFVDDVLHRQNVAVLLDEVTFDVIQNGDLEKAKEAEAIYKVIEINKIYGGIYSDLIREVFQNYSFTEMKCSIPNKNFVDILKTILEESSSVTRIIIAACNIKLVDIKTKKDLKLQSNILDQEDRELRTLRLSILSKRNEYIPLIAQEETKARREVKREELRAEERALINNSNVSLIYQILNLNTEAIPTKPRIEIARKAKTLAFALKENKQLNLDDSRVLKIANKMQRRGYREYLVEMKEDYIKRARNGESFDIRPKR